jgi:nicotinamidase-related amidase
MPATMLDPRTALIVIDLQKGIAAFPTVHPLAGVVENARGLAAVFRDRGLPVVLVNATGGVPGRAEQNFRGGRFRPTGRICCRNWSASPMIIS